MNRFVLLAGAVAVYVLAAWSVAPGFYDGFAPQQPYNWVCPPVHISGNLPPSSGHLVIKVINGVSDANSAFSEDGQVVIGFLPGAFDVTGKTSITVDIKPVSPCPKPSGLTFAVNTYLISADAPLVKKANLVMRYSDIVPAPSKVYRATSAEGPWTSIGALNEAQPFTIDTSTDQFGYFSAGYPSNAVSRGGTGSQVLPIVIAALIILVLVAGIPLAMMRRRQAPDEGEADDAEP
jgi:hypothetical protein